MINSLKDAISITLDNSFPHTKIYTESIKQGFKEPCFFIKVLNSDFDREVGRRYKKHIALDIHYFSDKDKVNRDCEYVANKLYELLDYVNVDGGILRSTKKKHTITDGVLHFFLQFNYFVMKEKEEVPLMRTLENEVYKK